MNFKVGQFFQYIHLEPKNIGISFKYQEIQIKRLDFFKKNSSQFLSYTETYQNYDQVLF